MAGRGEHRLDRVGVEPTGPHVGPQLGCRVVGRARLAVRPRLAHGLVGVGGAQDAGERRDRAAGQASRVAGAVEPLAVLHRDARERSERR